MTHEVTVFVVDDDEGALVATRYLLESARLPVETYASAEDFLSRYDPTRTGCLLTDLAMPDMTGLEMQRELASRGWHLPVILLTGSAEDDPRVGKMTADIFGYIRKPGDPDELLEMVHRALEKAVADQTA